MTQYIFANNVNTSLFSPISSTATSLTLLSATNLPTLSSGQIMPLTLNDKATRTVFEIVYVTAISGTTLTVTRGQEGTAAQNWQAGDYAFSTQTAQATELAIQSGAYNYAPDTGSTANAYVVALTPAIPATIPDGFPISMYVTDGRMNTGTPTLNGSPIVDQYGLPPLYGRIRGECKFIWSVPQAAWVMTNAGQREINLFDYMTLAQINNVYLRIGTVDVTTQVNAALANGGSLRIHAPAGIYSVSTLNITKNNTELYGDGDSTIFQGSSATADIFTVNGGTSISQILLKDFAIASSVVKTAGAAINCTNIQYSKFERISAQSQLDYAANGKMLWDGFLFNQFSFVNIEECKLIGCQHDGILAYGTTTTFSSDLVIDGHTLIFFAGNYGVHVAGGTGAVYFNDVSIFGCGRSIQYDQSVIAAANQQFFMTAGATVDSSNDSNIFIGANGAQMCEFTGPWICSGGYGPVPTGEMSGIHIDPTNASLQLRTASARIYNNKGYGVVINGGSVYIGGKSIVSNNGSSLTTGGHGIYNASAATNYVSVSDSIVINNSGTGIDIGVGPANGATINDNTITGNNTPISLPTVESLLYQVRGNVGYVSRNTGQATIAANGTSVVVTHGLSATPQNVMLTEATGNATIVYANSYTSTTFTITVAGTASTADTLVNWTATTGPAA